LKYKKQKIIILTTVYDEVEPYFLDFISSVNNQTYMDFDLVIVNDNFKNIKKYIPKFNLENIHIYEKTNLSIEENRLFGIDKCRELGAEIIVFADSDDAFVKNRIEKTIDYFSEIDLGILINEFNVCDSDLNITHLNFISSRIKNNSIISTESIRHYNFCGLSNSAIRLSSCDLNNIVINNPFDWSFFASLLESRVLARFTNETHTMYRQHNQNFVGIASTLNDDRIKTALKIKHKHYMQMDKKFKNFKDLSEFYNQALSMNEVDFSFYKEKCYRNFKENSFWWEEVMKWS
tara:strand:- start:405 stop:1277 length:873 start_codon:yes stop_codon:yes gene_type:complete